MGKLWLHSRNPIDVGQQRHNVPFTTRGNSWNRKLDDCCFRMCTNTFSGTDIDLHGICYRQMSLHYEKVYDAPNEKR